MKWVLNPGSIKPIVFTLIIGAIIGGAVSIAYRVSLAVWNGFSPLLTREPQLFLIFALMALLISSLLVRLFLRKKAEDSFETFLEYYHLSPEKLRLRDALVYSLASLGAFMFGAPVGPEGASVLMGAGISSWFKRKFTINMTYQVMLLTGLAAGFSAVFKTPLSGFLLALELPYKRDLEKEPFIAAAIASAAAYLVSFFLNTPSIINVAFTLPQLNVGLILLTILFGFIVGGLSIAFVKLYQLFGRLSTLLVSKASLPLLVLIGGLILGTLGYLEPLSIGPGLNLISITIAGGLALTSIIIILLFKSFAVITTLNFGGTGGTFLPAIEMGMLIGAAFGLIFSPIYVPFFALLGMGAAASGVNKVVLAPIAFVAEIVGSNAIIPVLLASIIAYFVSNNFSIYPVQGTSKREHEGLALERFYRRAISMDPHIMLNRRVKDVMTRNPLAVESGSSVRDTRKLLEEKSIRVIPLVAEGGLFFGYTTLEDLSALPTSAYDRPLYTLAIKKGLTFTEDAALEEVIQTMIERNEDHIFVINLTGQLVGIVANIDLIRMLMNVVSS